MSPVEPENKPGIRCPRCWSTWVPVSNTERLGKSMVRRRRQCQHCGHKFVTTERVGAPPPPGNSAAPPS